MASGYVGDWKDIPMRLRFKGVELLGPLINLDREVSVETRKLRTPLPKVDGPPCRHCGAPGERLLAEPDITFCPPCERTEAARILGISGTFEPTLR